VLAFWARVLALVACGPLLAPPTYCACRAGEPSVPQEHAPAAARPHTCGHCSHARNPHAEHPPEKPAQPAPADDHAPGCPAAAAGVERVRVAAPAAGAELPLPPVPMQGITLLPEPDDARPPDRPPRGRQGAPLYISHCALVL
jgi:hypothetical protein